MHSSSVSPSVQRASVLSAHRPLSSASFTSARSGAQQRAVRQQQQLAHLLRSHPLENVIYEVVGLLVEAKHLSGSPLRLLHDAYAKRLQDDVEKQVQALGAIGPSLNEEGDIFNPSTALGLEMTSIHDEYLHLHNLYTKAMEDGQSKDATITQLTKRITELEQQCVATRDSSTRLLASSSVATGDVSASASSTEASTIAALQEQCRQLQEHCEVLENNITLGLEFSVADVQREISSMQTLNENLSTNNMVVASAYLEAHQQLEARDKQLAACEAELKRTVSKKETAEKEVAALRAELERMRRAIHRLNT